MSKWHERLRESQLGSASDLLSICRLVTRNLSLLVTSFLLGFWVNFLRKRLFKPRIPLSSLWASDEKSVIWSTQTYTKTFFQQLGCKPIPKLRVVGQLIKAEITLRSVLVERSLVKALIFSLLTTHTRNKKPH
jgi:hypothetical protein